MFATRVDLNTYKSAPHPSSFTYLISVDVQWKLEESQNYFPNRREILRVGNFSNWHHVYS